MGRRAKPAKVKVDAKRPPTRKSPTNEGSAGVRDPEKLLAEALEQQAATSEILRVMSSSPTDLRPVFDTIAQTAARLCHAYDALIFRLNAPGLRIVAHHGPIPVDAEAVLLVDRATVAGRCVLDRQAVHVADVQAEIGEFPEGSLWGTQLGHRTVLGVPLLREGAAIGVINLRRVEVAPFTDKQIALLQTFADQAVIAIENVRLFNETKEALDRQTATSEILRVISSSPTDVQPTFDAIAASAARLCEAVNGMVFRFDGELIHVAAHHNLGGDELDAIRSVFPIQLGRGSIAGRAIASRGIVHVPDLSRDPEYPLAPVVQAGFRTALSVPMLREGMPIGTINVMRMAVEPFAPGQIELLKTFADQAVIAIENVRLFTELQQKNEALTDAHAQVSESLEQQTATAEILSVISGSPTDIRPVFDAVLDRALTLCEASNGSLYQLEDGALRHVGVLGIGAITAVGGVLSLESAPGWAVLEKRTVHIEDVLQELDRMAPEVEAGVRRSGVRTVVAVPLLREQTAIGAIFIRRLEVRPFSEKQIRLLQTFADQAVIAIENVRLFRELEERNRDLTVALDQQTATAEILRVISSSPTDVQPIFDAIVGSAVRLCNAQIGGAHRFDGEMLHFVAHRGLTSEALAVVQHAYPMRPDRTQAIGRAVLARSVVVIEDQLADPEYRPEIAVAEHTRSALAVPMLRDGEPLGVIIIKRTESGPFPDEQIALLQTFADQAVIAIENARLFTELQASNRELTSALDTQTATSDILRVISRSQTDVQPVFDAIVASAVRLLGAYTSVLTRIVDDQIELAALTSTDAAADATARASFPRPLRSEEAYAQAIRDRRPLNIADALTDPRWPEAGRANARIRGYRSLVVVPLLRHDEAIGTIAVSRREPGGFTDDEIALLQTFADQAVIAIENARLLSELQQRNEALTQAHAQVSEALEQQTATSEILKVIARSPTDTQPVFDAIVENAARLCSVGDGYIILVEDEVLRAVSVTGQLVPQAPVYNTRRVPLSRQSVAGRAIVDRATIHIADLAAVSEAEFPEVGALQRLFGHHTMLATPLLREGAAIGVIVLFRFEVRPFSERQMELLKTFADQAVIAVENVRLFTELQASNRELTTALDTQTATSDILRVISRSQTDVQPVFDAIVASAVRLLGGYSGGLTRVAGDQIALAALTSIDDAGDAAVMASFPRSIHSEDPHAQAIRDRAPVNIADSETHPGVPDAGRAAARAAGYRSFVAVPLLRHDEAVGTIAVSRREPGGFTGDEIALLQTFADQAVIAIENARLLSELQERNEALTQAHAQVSEALEQQTATSEILRVISHSPTDVQPVFDAVADSAMRLCEAQQGIVVTFDGELMHLAALAHFDSRGVEAMRQTFPLRPNRGSALGRAVLSKAVVHIPSLLDDPEYTQQNVARATGFRSGVAVPMLKDGRVIGVMAVARLTPGAFSDRQIELLQTFAAQAVIAIENVRLFTELRASNRELTTALDTQTATSDILRVISRSQTNVQPVFDAIVTSAVRLLRAYSGSLTRIAGDQIELAAFTSTDDTADAAMRAAYPRPLQFEGAHNQAIRARAPVNIADYQTDPRVSEAARVLAGIRGYQSMVAVPLLRHDEALGAIAVNRREPGGFTADEIGLLKTFADQAVIAIENARLLSELQARTGELSRSVDELTALGDVGRVLNSTLDLETVLQTIVTRANQLTGTAGCIIWEYDEARAEFRLRASHYADEGDVALLQAPGRVTTIPKGQGVTTRVMERRQPVQIHDITTARDYESPIRRPLVEAGHRALLGVPLVSENEVIGVLAVTRKTPGEFEPEIVRLLTTFATQSALAIQNARLFLEIEDKGRQLEAASQHKSEFLANMSHELRTPLNAIIGFSEVLADAMFGEVNEKQAEYLHDIQESGRHLLSLINDILDLSKIEAGRMELEPADFDLPGAIDNALTLVRERAGRRGIALGRAIDERVGTIHADERKVKQVLLNLLSNALKFTPEGGRIDVRSALNGELVEVSVADTGVGIAAEDQEAVFEEFRQVGTADKKVEGTGLGLALSRKFIELHGGRIWVKSQVGTGSTFTFTIPVRLGPSDRGSTDPTLNS